MTAGYDISLATPDDIAGILEIQEPNVHDRGGNLAVRQSAGWFRQLIDEGSVVVARHGGKVAGYVLGTSLAAKAHVSVVQAMLRVFPPPLDCYFYGPVCVAEAERGNGLAGAMFQELVTHMRGRSAMTFVRADNSSSLQAHRKMGMRNLGAFMDEGVPYVALVYDGGRKTDAG